MRRLLIPVALALAACGQQAQPSAKPEQAQASPQAQRFSQKHSQYLAAIGNDTTDTAYVYVTLVDGNTGTERSGCVAANFLVGAIHREHGIAYDPASHEKAKQLASDPSHRFVFKSKEALANVSFRTFQQDYREECAVILRGHSAWRGDIGNLLREGS